MKHIAIVSLLALVGLGAAPADVPTGEEEKLLLEVGKRLLRDGPKANFVCYLPDVSHDGRVSRDLLSNLRRYNIALRNCDEYVSPGTMLILGPITWTTPHREA